MLLSCLREEVFFDRHHNIHKKKKKKKKEESEKNYIHTIEIGLKREGGREGEILAEMGVLTGFSNKNCIKANGEADSTVRERKKEREKELS